MGEIQIQTLPHSVRWPVILILLTCVCIACLSSERPLCTDAVVEAGPQGSGGRSLDGSQSPGSTLSCGSTPCPVQKGSRRLCRSQLSVVCPCNRGWDLCRQKNSRALPRPSAERTYCLVTAALGTQVQAVLRPGLAAAVFSPQSWDPGSPTWVS